MKRRTPEQWQTLITEHQSSGLTAVEFCRQNNLNAKYFSLRKKRFLTKSNAFVKAVTPSSNSSFEPIRIHYQGVELCFPVSVSTQYLANLTKALACEA